MLPSPLPEGAAAAPDPDSEQAIRTRVLETIADNRVPGYHFPGHLLDLECRRFERAGVQFHMPAGAHCVEPDGTLNVSAVTVLADMSLASCNRIFLPPAVRTATLSVHLSFTGVPARGDLVCEARSEGFSPRTTMAQARCGGRVLAGDETVCHLAGAWVAPPAPAGMKLEPLPWEREVPVARPALAESDLDAKERRVLEHTGRSIDAARAGGGFLAHFWSGNPRATATGSIGRLALGMHTGNRVGHVQGGLLMGFTLNTALAAVPRHGVLTAVSYWFISPGEGRALSARSRVLQSGRNVAVVRTEVFGAGRRRVLEAISSHAVAAGDPR